MEFLLPLSLLFALTSAFPKSETGAVVCPLDSLIADLSYDEVNTEVFRFIQRLIEETVHVPEECDALVYSHATLGIVKYHVVQHVDTMKRMLMQPSFQDEILLLMGNGIHAASNEKKRLLTKLLQVRSRSKRSENDVQPHQPVSEELMELLKAGMDGIETMYLEQFQLDFGYMESDFTEPIALENLFFVMSEVPTTIHNYKDLKLSEVITKLDHQLRPLFERVTQLLRQHACGDNPGDLGQLKDHLIEHRDWVNNLDADDLMGVFPEDFHEHVPIEILRHTVSEIQYHLADTSALTETIEGLEGAVSPQEYGTGLIYYMAGFGASVLTREAVEAETAEIEISDFLAEHRDELYDIADSIKSQDREGSVHALVELLKRISIYVHHLQVPLEDLEGLFWHAVNKDPSE